MLKQLGRDQTTNLDTRGFANKNRFLRQTTLTDVTSLCYLSTTNLPIMKCDANSYLSLVVPDVAPFLARTDLDWWIIPFLRDLVGDE